MTIVITSGEPAGIGPDIILKAALNKALPGVVLGDLNLFKERAALLNYPIKIEAFEGQELPLGAGNIVVRHIPLAKNVLPGLPNRANAEYILAQLDAAVAGCLSKNYSAMVTAPVCKSIICEAGHSFTGHTEYIANLTNTKHVVMMLACKEMRVALVTTHLPLSEVSKAITKSSVEQTVSVLRHALKNQFLIKKPKIMVAGLNPHAGEDGYLGREEIEVISPALSNFDESEVIGPMAADTMFSKDNCLKADAFVAMYHDQGLAVLKYAGFGLAANISLGLPIIRTSVDHGTAFSLAGTGNISEGSFLYALEQARLMSLEEAFDLTM